MDAELGDLSVLLERWENGVIHGVSPTVPALNPQRPTTQSHGSSKS